MKKKIKLIVILGPTGSGKTDLAIFLCRKFNGEIISADSRQIYKEMNIGTAKTIPEDIPIYLINLISPDKKFTVAQYKKLANKKIKEIARKGKIPFLVGGTGLYIEAVCEGLEIPKIPPQEELRKKLEKKDLKELVKELLKLDPEAKNYVDLKNKRRVIRALEVCKISKKPFTFQLRKKKPSYEILKIGIKIDRKKLYKKLEKRVDKMIKKGLKKEVEYLVKKYGWEAPGLDSIGYKEFKLFKDLEKVAREIKKNTKNYAKRQITWFKRDKEIFWIRNKKEAEKLVKKFLEI